MKKLLNFLIIILSFVLFVSSAKANKINKVTMNVFIHSDGSAHVREVWNVKLDDGTEGYKSFSKLGLSEINNIFVYDGDYLYENIDKWDSSKSFLEKKHKYGRINKLDGMEICWGISEYGHHVYVLEYDITNFIRQYTDTQGIYFNFINIDQDVDSAKVTITSNIPFSLDNSRIWGFGFNGEVSFYDGDIVLTTNEKLSSDQYVVGMVRFNENIFESENQIEMTFDNEFEEAIKGSLVEKYDDMFSSISSSKKNKSTSNTIRIIFMLIQFLFFPVLAIILFIKYISKLFSDTSYNFYRFRFNNMADVDESKVDYYREIPCNKDIDIAYWISYQYMISENNDLRKGLISAYFLKWINKDRVSVIQNQDSLSQNNKYSFDLSRLNTNLEGLQEFEKSLIQCLLKASGSDMILQPEEFYNWSSINFNEFDVLYNIALSTTKFKLKNEGYITTDENVEKKTGVRPVDHFPSKKTEKVGDQINEWAKQLAGLKKFMLNFGDIANKEFFEVHIFEEYMIFASLLGIADKVYEQFKKLYPDYNTRLDYNSFSFINTFSDIFYNKYSESKKKYEESISKVQAKGSSESSTSSHDFSGSSNFSGGGGSTFSGGGSSAGGSSGGGFR